MSSIRTYIHTDVPDIGEVPINDAFDGPLLPEDVGVIVKDDNSMKVCVQRQ